MPFASALDFERAAPARLPRALFNYVAGGSFEEVTLQKNRRDFQQLLLRQRILRKVKEVSLKTRFLGQEVNMPVVLGPVGLAGMMARRSEAQAARAAARAGIPFCLSTVGICDTDEVAKATAPPWFQPYVLAKRAQTQNLITFAQDSGCRVLVLTVDVTTAGVRYREIRSQVGQRVSAAAALDSLRRPAWLWNVWLRGRPHSLGSITKASRLERERGLSPIEVKRDLGWDDVEWVRDRWDGPVIVKGVLTREDAQVAAKVGIDGIVVSNHGGRQLDGVSSSIAKLREIVDVVGPNVAVFLNGGVRSGLDILKALACGARGCLLGRPWVFALAAAGEQGVERLIRNIRDELSVAMMLSGCGSIEAIDGDLLDTRRSRLGQAFP